MKISGILFGVIPAILFCSCATGFVRQRYTNFAHHNPKLLVAEEKVSPSFLSQHVTGFSESESDSDTSEKTRIIQKPSCESANSFIKHSRKKKVSEHSRNETKSLSVKHPHKTQVRKITKETIGSILLVAFYFIELIAGVAAIVLLFINPIIGLIILAGCWLLAGLVFIGAKIIERIHNKRAKSKGLSGN